MTDCPDCPHARQAHYIDGCMLCTCKQSEDALAARGLAQGRALRDQGEGLAEDAAAEWREAAYKWIEEALRGAQFTAVDLTDAVGMPPHVNAVGAVVQGASKRGLTRNTGQYIQSIRRDRHAGRNAVWERL